MERNTWLFSLKHVLSSAQWVELAHLMYELNSIHACDAEYVQRQILELQSGRETKEIDQHLKERKWGNHRSFYGIITNSRLLRWINNSFKSR